MKELKVLLLILLVCAIMSANGCSSYQPEDFSAGTEVSPEALDSIAELIRGSQTEKYTSETDEKGNTVVYWTSGGSVWHRSLECQTLKSLSAVCKGTEEEAIAAGKSRVCSICGQE